MEKVLHVQKKEGETPLELIERIRSEQPEYEGVKMTYAGRLDPLASGEMIILCADEVHNKQKYLNKDKEYEVDIVLGVSTDTYDGLGLVMDEGVIKNGWQEKVKKYIDSHVGEFEQSYPAYSSKTVDGEQLHIISKRGDLVELPLHKVVLCSAEIVELRTISKEDLYPEITRKNALVNGDFRQVEIGQRWQDYFDQTEMAEYPVVSVKMKVGSGFYVRTFANDLGKYLKSEAFALKIVRIAILDK